MVMVHEQILEPIEKRERFLRKALLCDIIHFKLVLNSRTLDANLSNLIDTLRKISRFDQSKAHTFAIMQNHTPQGK